MSLHPKGIYSILELFWGKNEEETEKWRSGVFLASYSFYGSFPLLKASFVAV